VRPRLRGEQQAAGGKPVVPVRLANRGNEAAHPAVRQRQTTVVAIAPGNEVGRRQGRGLGRQDLPAAVVNAFRKPAFLNARRIRG